MFDRIQNINKVVGDNNIIINGDVTVVNEVLSKVANQLLRSELNKLTAEAREVMNAAVNECVQTIMNRLMEAKIESKFFEFAKPSTQFAFYSTLKGFTISETIEQRDLLVDVFIERIQSNWDSSEKMILDSALDILPKLSPQTLSTVGLLQLRHQLTNASIGFMLDQYFASLTPLAERMAQLNSLDIEYLKQERLILSLPGLQTSVSLEKYMLNQYDLFFRHPLPEGVYEEYCRKYPEALEAVSDGHIRACMMWIDAMHNNVTSFCCSNTRILTDRLKERHQEYIIPHVEALKQMMVPFTEDEVRTYFINLSPSWDRLFKLFSSDSFTMYTLSITGNYIGGKVLAKASHGRPLSLTDYNQRLTL